MSGLPTPYPAHQVDSRLIAGLPDNQDAIEGVMSFLEKRPPAFTSTVAAGLPAWLPWAAEADATIGTDITG